MALRFPTPHIEELPTTHQSRQTPGFAWVAVPSSATATADPSKNWGANKSKRARNAAAGQQSDSQREALSARQQREVERRIRDLNSDGSKDKDTAGIAVPKQKAATADGAASGASAPSRAGRTPNTKKMLSSGKTFAHYLDDEEAEIQRTGKRDGDLEVLDSKDLRARAHSDSVPPPPHPPPTTTNGGDNDPLLEGDEGALEREIQRLLALPPLTYAQARSAPPPPDAPPARRFCRVCGYFGRARCARCGAGYCSVACKDAHDAELCARFYA